MTVTHPSEQTLAAYGLGKLDDAAAAGVQTHLAGCEACKRRVADLSADSFIGKFQDGHAGRSAGGFTGLSFALRSMPGREDVPTELLALTQYTKIRELGRGGMGVVYVAKNTDMDRREALKVVQRSSLEQVGTGAVERFLREIQAAARLQHPNVVTAYTVHRPGNLLVFAMEYAPGHDLAKVVKAKGPLAVPVACSYVHAAALGLQHAHEAGMVHRDIKPGNLILTKVNGKPAVKVLDFGLAKVTTGDRASTDLTGDGKMMGTPDYMAPEQAVDATRADIRADVYSLGCTLYYLLAGKSPFGGGTLMQVIDKHRFTEATALNLVQPTVPVELAAVVAKMLAKDPAKRHQTPAEVAKAVRPFIGRAATRPATVPPRPVTSETSRPAATAPVQPAPKPDPTPVVTVGPRPAKAEPVRQRPGRFWPAVMAVGLLALVAAGAGIVFRTPDGTLHLDGVPADAEVVLDGSTATVTRNGETVTLTAKRGPHRLKVVQGGVELLIKDDGVVTVGGTPVRVRVEPPTSDEVLAPQGSEWAGTSVVTDAEGATRTVGLTLTMSERRGEAFRYVGRNSRGNWNEVSGTISPAGRLVRLASQQLRPEKLPARTDGSLTGQVSRGRMTYTWEFPEGSHGKVSLKRLPDGGGFDFPGLWDRTADGAGPPQVVTVLVRKLTVAGATGEGSWERDGGLVQVRLPGGGAEWLVIDPDDPNTLAGGNESQSLKWVRRAAVAPPGERVLHRFQSGDADKGLGPGRLRLMADGLIRNRRQQPQPGTWERSADGKSLVLRWTNAAAPGGVWVDTYTSDDGVEFRGSNNFNPPRRFVGRLLGPPSVTELADDAKTVQLADALLTHTWNYVDDLYPPGGPVQFFDNGTFHEKFRWRYWVVGPTEMRVSYDRNNSDWASGVSYTFNDDLTRFTGEFTDEKGRLHHVTGTRE